ncbi:hypothetical protein KSP39_PZI018919 [Platanthera zijinensis]|uniref:Uncharacterized protein n=1 Tax=Platanthera zijinensis TaxID=2320716 RepID=A0AAP0FZ30_9ASPA
MTLLSASLTTSACVIDGSACVIDDSACVIDSSAYFHLLLSGSLLLLLLNLAQPLSALDPVDPVGSPLYRTCDPGVFFSGPEDFLPAAPLRQICPTVMCLLQFCCYALFCCRLLLLSSGRASLSSLLSPLVQTFWPGLSIRRGMNPAAPFAR